MKLLCVGNYKTPSNAWRRVLMLKEMGYDVQGVDMSFCGILRSQRLAAVTGGVFQWIYVQLLNQRFFRELKSFRPDVIYFEKAQPFHPKTLKRVKQILEGQVTLAHYNPDEFFGENSPQWWGYFPEAIPEYDVHFVPKEINVEDYKQRGADKVIAVDRSYDPTLHRKVDLTPEEEEQYGCDVGFIGSYAPYREQVIADLISEGIPVAVWGNGWEKGPNWNTIQTTYRGGGQYNEDYTRAVNGMKIALHFLRKENRDLQDSRSFEIPACGVCMLAERSSDHERLFEEDEEAVFFSDGEECREKLISLLASPEKVASVAEKAYQKTRNAPYSHKDRLQEMMSSITELIGPLI